MQKDISTNEPYAVTVSDWISILQDKKGTHFNLYIFLASAIIGMIIVIPQLVRDAMGSSLYASGMLILLLGFMLGLFRLINRKSKKINKPYEDLYKKVIYGEINDPKKIRDLYKEIEEKMDKLTME